MNVFEIATRKKFRFPSSKGELTAEQLWDLPLTSRGGADLDSVARAVNSELKSVTEESFVNLKPDPRRPSLEAKLEVVKTIIATKLKENEEDRAAVERAQKRTRLAQALAAKQDQALTQMSEEEILKQLAELDG